MGADLIRYDLLVQDALRSVVKKVLSDAARNGLPGDHHFNISFKTRAPGVLIPQSIKQRYPEEMAIILQHEFWDLVVGAEQFEVSLNFSRKPERLTIPFDAITGFSDPSVPFGFKLEPRGAVDATQAPKDAPVPIPAPQRELAAKSGKSASAKPESPAKLVAAPKPEDKPPEKPAEGDAAKVVSIDSFRKK
jgi:hypothetical protein